MAINLIVVRLTGINITLRVQINFRAQLSFQKPPPAHRHTVSN